MCHQVRGTLAGGRVAPDLTHIGSRLYIAANSYPNNDAYLKPGSRTPNRLSRRRLCQISHSSMVNSYET